jgi:hypothetical protein
MYLDRLATWIVAAALLAGSAVDLEMAKRFKHIHDSQDDWVWNLIKPHRMWGSDMIRPVTPFQRI